MKRNQIIALAIILVIGILFIPKLLKGNEGQIKFKEVKEEEIPDKISEVLPKYLMEERALTCKYKDDIYVVVTRGEKKSKGYLVEINQIIKEKYSKDVFDIVVYAKFTDPDPNEIVEQEYDYPYIVVKTNLKDMPEEVHLDIEYVE
ncbi:protease complex subunit PrcB family protein [Tissierella carlieri]|uniref:Protease complex subunit PrcB family protein n=1 Tax=Tissierella carlieri TaxID=689904 RepID=A0ABT1SAM9_9FIRM|nr:protease complex subunit PrcB family protein [Tissierella carlieri]MBU5313906.1 protease complex subunit PrcB family protein [Tissierella carlieri]MCQ4923530.1 protease complex subunit PrcB family protein [Tissierella carlieri]